MENPCHKSLRLCSRLSVTLYDDQSHLPKTRYNLKFPQAHQWNTSVSVIPILYQIVQRHLPKMTKTKHIVHKPQNYSLHHICHGWLYQANALISQQEDLHTFSSCHHSQMMPTANNQLGTIISKWWASKNSSIKKLHKI